MYMAGTIPVWLVVFACCVKAASAEEQIFHAPQRVLEGIGPADLRGAREVTDEDEWGFIARLVPSVFTDFPTLCNLVYIELGIYVAPMKCLIGVDTKIVAIRHKQYLLYVETSILPDEDVSANYFDDVGFLIAKATSDAYNNNTAFERAKVTAQKRTDNNFTWVKNLEGKAPYHLISFVDVGLNLAKRYRQYTRLYTAENVTFSRSEYEKALRLELGETSPRDRAPCVLLCPPAKICPPRFLFTLGSVLVDNQRTVIGISTWQDSTDIRYMTPNATHPPIGVAIPNKLEYKKNLECAVKIRDYHYNSPNKLNFTRPYALYGKLCN